MGLVGSDNFSRLVGRQGGPGGMVVSKIPKIEQVNKNGAVVLPVQAAQVVRAQDRKSLDAGPSPAPDRAPLPPCRSPRTRPAVQRALPPVGRRKPIFFPKEVVVPGPGRVGSAEGSGSAWISDRDMSRDIEECPRTVPSIRTRARTISFTSTPSDLEITWTRNQSQQ
jgi:hypothetical protein